MASHRQRALAEGLENLNPAYFAMTMATGIIAVAAHLLAMPRIAFWFTWLNSVVYAVLWLLYLCRLAFFPASFLRDLIDHRRGPGFFTIVAGTCVLGSQMVVVFAAPRVAMLLWLFGLVLWIAVNYTVFAALTVKKTKPSLEKGINGGWLVSVVATQSVSILGEQLVGRLHPYEEVLHLFALSFWLWGGMLYIWLISLIFYRYAFFAFEPSDLMPPYWINMGAMAISTLAGCIILNNAGASPLLAELIPFIKGLTLMFWATATWWIPMLLILCTWRLAEATALPFLLAIPRVTVYAALAAWGAVFLGLLHRLAALAMNQFRAPEARDKL